MRTQTFYSVLIALIAAISTSGCNARNSPTDSTATATAKADDKEIITERFVYQLLDSGKSGQKSLTSMGEKAFPHFINILDNNRTTGLFYAQIFYVLNKSTCDISIFKKYILQSLQYSNTTLVCAALSVFNKVCSREDLCIVFALLANNDIETKFKTIDVIESLGGINEADALSIYRLNKNVRADSSLEKRIDRCIATIKSRISANETKN